MNGHFAGRREFLHFLAGSPLLTSAMAQDPVPTIASSKDAISVMDFEPLARKALPPAHWGYLATGVDDDLTLRMNREAMLHYQLRARRLSGVAKADLKTELFGASWDMPIYVSAVGSQKQFHPEGELATARAAKRQKAMQMLSDRSGRPKGSERAGTCRSTSAPSAPRSNFIRKASWPRPARPNVRKRCKCSLQ